MIKDKPFRRPATSRKPTPKPIDWEEMATCKLDEYFIRRHAKDFDNTFKTDTCFTTQGWEKISVWQTLSEDFMREFKDKLEWHYIVQYQKLSEDFIREMKDYLNSLEFSEDIWSSISFCQELSEDFMREMKDYLVWERLVSSQHMSECFMEEMNEYFNAGEVNCTGWSSISQYRPLSKDFIIKFKDKLIQTCLLSNVYIDQSIVEEVYG